MRTFNNNWRTALAAAIASCFLVACGGGGGDGNNGGGVATPIPAPIPAPIPTPTPTTPAPAVAEARIAAEGLDWINIQRGQLGVAALAKSPQISAAAQAHSNYQKANNLVTHDEETGKPGFTGLTLKERLPAAGYVFNPNNNYAYGEVISASASTSGQFLAEELVTAIYHRFVMFEPVFKEIGTGAATRADGYSYFTANLTANNDYGTGLGQGNVVMWPVNGQTGVTPNFFSDFEAPDPVPGRNEVGYPISVHGDINSVLDVQTFKVRERGAAADLPVRLIKRIEDKNDPNYDATAPFSAMSIIPLTPLKAGTTYDVTFIGTIYHVVPANHPPPTGPSPVVPVTKNWAFTTR